MGETTHSEPEFKPPNFWRKMEKKRILFFWRSGRSASISHCHFSWLLSWSITETLNHGAFFMVLQRMLRSELNWSREIVEPRDF